MSGFPFLCFGPVSTKPGSTKGPPLGRQLKCPDSADLPPVPPTGVPPPSRRSRGSGRALGEVFNHCDRELPRKIKVPIRKEISPFFPMITEVVALPAALSLGGSSPCLVYPFLFCASLVLLVLFVFSGFPRVKGRFCPAVQHAPVCVFKALRTAAEGGLLPRGTEQNIWRDSAARGMKGGGARKKGGLKGEERGCKKRSQAIQAARRLIVGAPSKRGHLPNQAWLKDPQSQFIPRWENDSLVPKLVHTPTVWERQRLQDNSQANCKGVLRQTIFTFVWACPKLADMA